MHGVSQDIRYAVRNLLRTPGATIVMILTLALGLGASASIFAVVNAVVLRPLPFPEPHQLVRLTSELRAHGATDTGVAWREWLDYQTRTDLFVGVAGFIPGHANVSGIGPAERVDALGVTPAYFSVLSVPPALGRVVNAGDVTDRGAAVAVISDGFWRRRFAASERAIGSTVTVDGEAITIIGVMPPGFGHPGRTLQGDVDVWRPLGLGDTRVNEANRTRRILEGAIARLQPGVSIDDARARLAVYGTEVTAQHPADYPVTNGWAPHVVTITDDVVGNVSTAMFIVLAGVGLVLLVATVNVANLMIARTSERRHELAIRQSLGASSTRLSRQLLVESSLVAIGGGAGALLVMLWGVKGIVALAPSRVPRLAEVAIDGPVFAVVAGLSAVIAVVLGILPAAQAARAGAGVNLRDGGARVGSGGAQARAQAVLVSAEVALATILLILAGLFVRTVGELMDVPLGFETKSLLTARVWLPQGAAPDRFQDAVLERLERVSGVQHVALSSQIPMGGFNPPLFFAAEGRDLAGEGARPVVHYFQVSPAYFQTLGVPTLEGRGFTGNDRPGAEPVVVVSASAAQAFWPAGSAVGQRLRFAPQSPWMTIVGVVADVRSRRLNEAPPLIAYRPLAQAPSFALGVLVRTTPGASAVGASVTREIQAVDPSVPVYSIRTMDDLIGQAVAQRRFTMRVLVLFGVVALVLALLGLYGVLAYSVTRRRREIGIRLAVGARGADVARMVLRQGLRLAVLGVVVGVPAALLLSRVVQSQLFGVSADDPVAIGGAILSVLLIAAVAAYLPARRAAGVNPLLVLRGD